MRARIRRHIRESRERRRHSNYLVNPSSRGWERAERFRRYSIVMARDVESFAVWNDVWRAYCSLVHAAVYLWSMMHAASRIRKRMRQRECEKSAARFRFTRLYCRELERFSPFPQKLCASGLGNASPDKVAGILGALGACVSCVNAC